MNPPHEKPDPGRDSTPKSTPKRRVRTHTPRPDELSRETFEFIAAVDEYKRRHMRSFLNDEEVIDILTSLGYAREDEARTDAEGDSQDVDALGEARERYRNDEGRLFPTWSEVFQLLLELGYRREKDTAA